MSLGIFNPLKALIGTIQGVRKKGIFETLKLLYMVGEFKFGELKGVDAFGNKYYENLDLPYGQHRWVEYADIHNFDATMIQPEWHGWMHHMYDEVPGEQPKHKYNYIPTHTASNSIYHTHVYEPKIEPIPQVNQSQLRQRGWNVGSLQTNNGEPDKYWLHSGHPLNPRAYGDDGSPAMRYMTPKKKEEAETHLDIDNYNPSKKPPPLKLEDIKFDM